MIEKYGLDSVMVMQMTSQLERRFGPLPKTLFYEHHSVSALAAYFIETYPHHFEPSAAKQAPQPSGATGPPAPSQVRSASPVGATAENRRAELPSADIAVIGLAGRYAQADDYEAFWQNLRSGRDCVEEVPIERWDHAIYFDADKGLPGKTYCKWGGFIADADKFDPAFFGMSLDEARYVSPQERHFLQCAYESIEDAGYTPATLAAADGGGAQVGVFVGVNYEEYQLFGAERSALGQHMALPGSQASIANRVSYFCNFQGPSMAIDAMSASSLIAVHQGCQSILRGECAVALAGGVNLCIHPNKYLLLGQGKFASSNGRCMSFGEGGDGYVPGEGVGAVLLKPLRQAEADGDQIYGVIKATAVNHGGKTTGYTVPNPQAQAAAIRATLARAGIDARTISYVEAHGTGTALGDPIEIAGLSKAFATGARQFCAIGSVKSNIGHCESAAGIAGLTKVLLQLRHGELVASLHARELNRHIAFAQTPFYVQREPSAWRRPRLVVEGVERDYPRRAGLSSFGAGGSNAHAIVEEYQAGGIADRAAPAAGPALIVLSARKAAQLNDSAARLLRALQAGRYRDADLASMAYTLQVGREAMEVRLALLVTSIADLATKLTAFLDGSVDRPDMYFGQTTSSKDALDILRDDDDLAGAVAGWWRKGKYDKLLGLWVKGLDVDWIALAADRPHRKISLPTYPFETGRYWLARSGAHSAQKAMVEAIHPLLHLNTSNAGRHRFTSRFSGNEHFFADHRLRGTPLLPAAACIEMAYVAIREFSAADDKSRQPLVFNEIVWLRPIRAELRPFELHTQIRSNGDDVFQFEIYSHDEGGTQIVHMQGSARPVGTAPDAIDLSSLQRACNRRYLAAEEIYERLTSWGLDYGPSCRGLIGAHIGEEAVLAEIRLPSEIVDGATQYTLHPTILDSALQAIAGLEIQRDGLTAEIPFAADEIQVHGGCGSSMWASITQTAQRNGGLAESKFDVDVIDPQGRIAVRIVGLSCRPLPAHMRTELAPLRPQAGGLEAAGLFLPRWEPVGVAEEAEGAWPLRPVLLVGGSAQRRAELLAIMPQACVLEQA